jgi:hypothetical protein
MGVLSANVLGSQLQTGWQNQSAGACINGMTTCTIFPASIFALQCGDGQTFTPAGATNPVTDPAPCNTEAVDPLCQHLVAGHSARHHE